MEDCVINPSQQLDIYSFLFWTCGHLIGKLSYSKIRSPVAKNMARVTKVVQQRQLKSILHAYDRKKHVHIYSSYLLKPLPLTFTITHPRNDESYHPLQPKVPIPKFLLDKPQLVLDRVLDEMVPQTTPALATLQGPQEPAGHFLAR